MNDKDNAMYLVYTEDKDFVLNKEDINSGESGGSYTLPIASANTLGGVKVGSGLSITDSGVLSATGGGESFYEVDIIVTLSDEGNVFELDITTEDLLNLLLSGARVFTRDIVDVETGETTLTLIESFTYLNVTADYFVFKADHVYTSEALNLKPSCIEY